VLTQCITQQNGKACHVCVHFFIFRLANAILNWTSCPCSFLIYCFHPRSPHPLLHIWNYLEFADISVTTFQMCVLYLVMVCCEMWKLSSCFKSTFTISSAFSTYTYNRCNKSIIIFVYIRAPCLYFSHFVA